MMITMLFGEGLLPPCIETFTRTAHTIFIFIGLTQMGQCPGLAPIIDGEMKRKRGAARNLAYVMIAECRGMVWYSVVK
jgi:hypothetical protein